MLISGDLNTVTAYAISGELDGVRITGNGNDVIAVTTITGDDDLDGSGNGVWVNGGNNFVKGTAIKGSSTAGEAGINVQGGSGNLFEATSVTGASGAILGSTRVRYHASPPRRM